VFIALNMQLLKLDTPSCIICHVYSPIPSSSHQHSLTTLKHQASKREVDLLDIIPVML